MPKQAAQIDTAIPDDRLVDFIDGTLRKKTPEEYVRQNVERSIVQEYRYDRDDVEVEYRIKVGSSRKRVDLALFQNAERHKQEDVYVLIECKKEGVSLNDRKEGVEQLKSYLAACPNAKFGLWTNGTDERICFRRDEIEGNIEFAEVVDIPLKGQEAHQADAPKRRELRPATGDNLLFAFKRCHNYIAGNQGLQKPEAFWELLKVIFCKIEDERSTGNLKFYVSNREAKDISGQLKCKNRVDKLFKSVKSKYEKIFRASDEIELNRTVLAYLVSQIQKYSLLSSSVDVKGVAYEEIVGSNLRGDRGEFFTPRNACRMAVHMLDPNPGAMILDPACGTGGFLITAMNLVLEKLDQQKQATWSDKNDPTQAELLEFYRARQELIERTMVGLDINPNLVRAAKMNMVMNNDGSGGLTQADSLKDLLTWSEESRELAKLGSFDFVFTNPPFGTKIRIDSPEVLNQYDLAAVWDWDKDQSRWSKRTDNRGRAVFQSSRPPEILFIERCVQFLKPGEGQMAMVIPNGILNNPPLGYVRQWILDNCQVLAVVDMQRDLFQPHNDTQTSMVILKRLSEKAKTARRDYPIFFAVTHKIGHDKRGNTIFVRDESGDDVLQEKTIQVETVKNGKLRVKQIIERMPIIDDHLPLIPQIFHEWKQHHGI